MIRALLHSPYWLFILLLLLLAGLQYRLWFGESGIYQTQKLERKIEKQQSENQRLLERNKQLEAEVIELKKGTETIEERARHKLGMVKEGETLYIIPNDAL